MEHGITTHRHQFLLARIRIVHGVSDDTEWIVIGTCVLWLRAPYAIRDIGIADFSFSLAIPSPPTKEVTLANR